MVQSTFDVVSRLMCPEFLRGPAQRLKQCLRVRLGKLRVIRSVEELDREIERLGLAVVSEGDLDVLGRVYLDHNWSPRGEPESEEYRQSVMEAYHYVSGRASYESSQNEWMPELPP